MERSTLNKYVIINLQIFEFVIMSQDANPSPISHNSTGILEEQHFVSC